MRKLILALAICQFFFVLQVSSQITFDFVPKNPPTGLKAGDEFDVDIIVKNFYNVAAFQYAVEWDASLLQFVSATKGENFPYSGYLSSNPYNDNLFFVSWYGGGQSDNIVVYHMRFKIVSNSSNYWLKFSDKYLNKEVYDYYGNIITSNTVFGDFGIPVYETPVPPRFNYYSTPKNDSTIEAIAGNPIVFNINAIDGNVEDNVTLDVVNAPNGSSFSTTLPVNGNPVNTIFTWTPTLADAGKSHLVSFTASDQTGKSASTFFNIKVEACKPTASINGTYCEGGSINLTSNGGISYQWSGPNGFNSNEQNPRIFNAINAMTGEYRVKITCLDGTETTLIGDVLVSNPVGGTILASEDKICDDGEVSLSLKDYIGTIVRWEYTTEYYNNDVKLDYYPSDINIVPNSIGINNITHTPPSAFHAGNHYYYAIVKTGDCATVKSQPIKIVNDKSPVGGGVYDNLYNYYTSTALCNGENIGIEPKEFRGRIVNWQLKRANSPVWLDMQNSENKTSLIIDQPNPTTYYRVIIKSEFGYCANSSDNIEVAYSRPFKVSKSDVCTNGDNNDIANPLFSISAKLFPTPVKDILNIEIESPIEQFLTLKVMDITGKIIKTEKQSLQAASNLIEMNVSHISAGMYMLHIENAKGERSSYKFMKTR